MSNLSSKDSNGRSRSTISSGRGSKSMYISELPFRPRRELCNYLDRLNVWMQLAEEMQLHPHDIERIGKHNQPTNELLKIWGERYNHKVCELFEVLHRRELFEAMTIIKEFVGTQYHGFIHNRPNLSELMAQNTTEKIPNCSAPAVAPVSISCNNISSSAYTATTHSNNTVELNSTIDPNYISARKVKEHTMGIVEVDYKELYDGTKGFHKDLILGNGGFGTVYKGRFKHTDVAIKVINPHDKSGNKVDIVQSLNELKYLTGYRHDNLVSLFAISLRGEKKCLVYELVPGGTLYDRLYRLNKWPALKWREKFNVCKGIARGINYLHTSRTTPLIHGDIKPANVLLTECLIPKIGDFGLAREGPHAINSALQVSHVFGTKYYSAPEARNKMLSTKLDTYSYGIVVLETFTGLLSYDQKRANKELAKHIFEFFSVAGNKIEDLIDKRTPALPEEQRMCADMIRIGCVCIAPRPEQRPEMDPLLIQCDAIEDNLNRSTQQAL